VVAIAVLAILVAAYFAPSFESDRVALSGREPVPVLDTPSRTERRSPLDAPSAVLSIKERATGEVDDGPALFTPTQWTRPPRKVDVPAESVPTLPMAPAASAPAKAPPLPFRVIGRYVEDGQTGVFLQHNEHNLVVHAGDTVANVYQVLSLEGGVLTLLYIPLNEKQTLRVEETN
jgi:hypothetical protein